MLLTDNCSNYVGLIITSFVFRLLSDITETCKERDLCLHTEDTEVNRSDQLQYEYYISCCSVLVQQLIQVKMSFILIRGKFI